MPYIEGMDDAPGGLKESKAAVAAGLAQARTAVSVTQVEAAQFMRENGHDAATHAPVGEPGRMGDPDPALDAGDQ
jgi:hypothetical protein